MAYEFTAIINSVKGKMDSEKMFHLQKKLRQDLRGSPDIIVRSYEPNGYISIGSVENPSDLLNYITREGYSIKKASYREIKNHNCKRSDLSCILPGGYAI
jgi:hypothetical protein